jgi:ribosomal-protein-alanine N-acetyltransferase
MTEPSGISLRRMRWWDLPDVVALDSLLFTDTAWSAAMFWSELAAVPATRDYVVATIGDELIGYGGLMTVAHEATVQTLGVAATWQQQGLGRRMLDTFVAAARRRSAGLIWLEVAADNAAARALYSRAGFEAVSNRRDYYGSGRDAVVMRRRLSEVPAS